MRKILLLIALTALACQQKNDKQAAISMTPAYDAIGNMQAVIEIPAGTNKKIEYDKSTDQMIADRKNGQERIISFLPYPGNYGYIPGTLSDKSKGGDGDPVDMLVLSSSLSSGTVLPIKPIAMLKLMDNGEEDFKVLAVPVVDSLNVLGISNWDTANSKIQAVQNIIETWFLNYDSDPAEVLGWEGTDGTRTYIESQIIAN